MSRFNSIVPVPLGEIRRIEGKLGASAIAGQLLTAVDSFAAGDSLHAQSDGATFTLNGAANNEGVLILVEQDDNVTGEITDTRAINTWGRGHVLKSGEEVTVVLTSAATAITAGALLVCAANGKVGAATAGDSAKFTAIETASTAATGDQLRILARVL